MQDPNYRYQLLRKARATIADMAVAEVRAMPRRPVKHQHLRKLQGLVRLNHLMAKAEKELEAA